MKSIDWRESIPCIAEYDVIVAGGGISGVAAALSAARLGKKTALIEKNTVLGGLATIGLINYWEPLCNGRGKLVIRGLAEELLHLSIRYGFDTLPKEWKNGEPSNSTNVRYVTNYSIGYFALVLTRLLHDEGITIYFDTLVSAPVMKDGHCSGLIIDGKSGRNFIAAGIVVDATGDADILYRAGVPTIDGENYFTMAAEGIDLEHCRKAVEANDISKAYIRFSGGIASLYGDNHPTDMPTFKGISMEVENDYLIRNQLLLLSNASGGDRFERDIHLLPGVTQFRTTRRLEGNETLCMNDLYRHCDTSVGAICDFDNRDRLFEVPYGSLIRRGFDNLITCGRSVSGEGWCWDVLRVIPPAALTGQAAGTAAALALEEHVDLNSIDIGKLQEYLTASGVLIHFPDTWIPADSKRE